MSHMPSASSTPDTTRGSLSTKVVLLQLADTTWRIVVPVLALAGAGLFIDRKIGTGPWLTLAGMALGFVFAGLLVKKQVDAVLAEEERQ